MRFLHLADLHLGKFLHGISLLENGDQTFWAERFLEMAREIRPDAVLIAGDVYDRSVPSGGAVRLLDKILTTLAGWNIPVMMTAGNHDSIQRLSFMGDLLSKQGIYISRPLTDSRELVHVTLSDSDGDVTFWLMPYIFPALAAQALRNENLRDYDSAVRAVLAAQNPDSSKRNVLIAHQNVTARGKEIPRGGSESMVGGVGQVDYSAFDLFDYVALGHIHAAYPVGRDSVRYAGSPMCYHFDEIKQPKKGPVLVELGPKGTPPKIEIQSVPVLRPMRELRGAYREIHDAELAERRENEYISIVLTDRRVTPEISDFFRDLYQQRGSLLMEIRSEYNNYNNLNPENAARGGNPEEQSMESLFEDFYTERVGEAPEQKEMDFISFVMEQVRRAENPGGKPTDDEIDKLLNFALGEGDWT